MTSYTDAAAGGSERIDVAVHKAGGDGPLTPRAAANSVIDWRRKNRASAKVNATEQGQAAEPRRESPSAEATTGTSGEPAPESSFAGSGYSDTASAAPEWSAEPLAKQDAAPQETEVPGKTERADPDELPTIEPPRSWTKEEKERFRSLPRETQEYLAARRRGLKNPLVPALYPMR